MKTNKITCKKFHGLSMAIEKINARPEQEGQRHPEKGPQHGFLHFDDVGFSVEDTQIKGQHGQYKEGKKYPPP